MADFNWGLAALSPSAALVKYAFDNVRDNKKADNDTATYKSKPQPQPKAPVKDPKVETEAAETTKKLFDTAINAFDNVKKMVTEPFDNPKNAQHTVKAGENLSMIAKKYRTSVADLQAANGIDDPNKIKEGQVLKVPGGVVAEKTADNAENEKVEKFGQHTVAKGENLSIIAKKYGASVADLQAANGIDDPNKIKEGQVLKVPGEAMADTNVDFSHNKNYDAKEKTAVAEEDLALLESPDGKFHVETMNGLPLQTGCFVDKSLEAKINAFDNKSITPENIDKLVSIVADGWINKQTSTCYDCREDSILDDVLPFSEYFSNETVDKLLSNKEVSVTVEQGNEKIAEMKKFYDRLNDRQKDMYYEKILSKEANVQEWGAFNDNQHSGNYLSTLIFDKVNDKNFARLKNLVADLNKKGNGINNTRTECKVLIDNLLSADKITNAQAKELYKAATLS